MSMNNILYKRTGNGNGPILQWSQGRMGDQPWDDMERWMSQSPVHQAPNISTPFLILHGTEDGAVDWNQGLELYTAARRLEKEVILLSYPGEPHHLENEANQKDFQRRMKEYFDHHLTGAPAPEWMTDGVPHLRKGKEDRKAVIS
jgi:dipeptidyl aminopeptidase/acylaminoacyl peptidase